MLKSYHTESAKETSTEKEVASFETPSMPFPLKLVAINVIMEYLLHSHK